MNTEYDITVSSLIHRYLREVINARDGCDTGKVGNFIQ